MSRILPFVKIKTKSSNLQNGIVRGDNPDRVSNPVRVEKKRRHYQQTHSLHRFSAKRLPTDDRDTRRHV
ncbi:MAG: hypothetical protein CSA05_02805 [Bacteroidia bacterium]|nr:MAG: hypothetical protein CSA05_02805 [Bacteroidia bacterium]